MNIINYASTPVQYLQQNEGEVRRIVNTWFTLTTDWFIKSMEVVRNFYFVSAGKLGSYIHFTNQFLIFHSELSAEFWRLYLKSNVLTGELRGIFGAKIGKTLLKQVLLTVSYLTILPENDELLAIVQATIAMNVSDNVRQLHTSVLYGKSDRSPEAV